MTTPPRRPRLALPFTILTERDTVRLVAGEDFRYTLTGPGLDGWLPAWLAGLDGRTLLAEAIARLPEAHRAAARQLADQLYGERVLIDGAASDAHTPAQVRLVPDGSAAWAIEWKPLGAGRPLPAFCQDRLDYEEALCFNCRCLDAGTAWLWASTGPMGRAYVSPLFLPDAGPCLSCLLNHFRRLSPAPELYDALTAHARGGGEVVPVAFPEPGIAIVQQLLLWKAALAAEPEPSSALYRLHVVESAPLEVTWHRVFVDPECPDCRSRR
ncbi:MAG: TOMM precursor leader peptide-binding protein [Gemmataceae bacterium]|nr:TOMM precursor leader peptide-binding protein [Gemmataceae bacterium]